MVRLIFVNLIIVYMLFCLNIDFETQTDLNIKCQSHVHCSSWSCEVRLRLSAPSSVMHNGAGITVLRDITVVEVKLKSRLPFAITKKRTSIWHPVTSGSAVGQVTILICFGNIVNLCSGR